MQNPPKVSRDQAIDLLRALSVLAVVLTHITTRTLETANFQLAEFGLTLFLNQIGRFAVALFFLVSGFVLEKSNSGQFNFLIYIKKRTGKILVPYVIWSFVYYFFVYRTHTTDFISTLVSGSASYQLYFIPAIFLFYLLFPLFHRFFKFFSRPDVLIFLGVIQLGLLSYDYYIQPLDISLPIKTVILNYFAFVIGVVAARHRQQILFIYTKIKYLLLLLLIPLSIFIFWESQTLYLQTHNYLTFYSTWRPAILIYSLIVGWLFYGIFSTRMPFPRFIKAISRSSYFIFYSHVLVLETIWPLIKNYYTIPGFDVFFFVAVAGISGLSAFFIHKIPKLANLVG